MTKFDFDVSELWIKSVISTTGVVFVKYNIHRLRINVSYH